MSEEVQTTCTHTIAADGATTQAGEDGSAAARASSTHTNSTAAAPPRPRSSGVSKSSALVAALVVLVLALGALQFGGPILAVLRGAGALERPPMLYALANVIPTAKCVMLSPEQVRQGWFDTGVERVQLRDIRLSLLYHMEARNMGGICAQYLHMHRVCYCIVNAIRQANHTQNLVEMYNLGPLVDWTPYNYTRVTERTPFCEQPVTRYRYTGVSVEYMDGEGLLHTYSAGGVGALVVQQVLEAQDGKASCQDSNQEAMLARIERRLEHSQAQHDTDRRLALPR